MRKVFDFLRWFFIGCLVLALFVPIESWNAMSGYEKDALVLLTIEETCRELAQTTGCRKFRIRLETRDGKVELHIEPVGDDV